MSTAVKKSMLLFVTILLFAHCTACSNAQEKSVGGAVIGTVVGTVIGHQSKRNGEGALIGAAAGSVLGYMIGNEEDKKEAAERGPGHWEKQDKKIWVPETIEKTWSPDVYETRYDSFGQEYQILIEEGHNENNVIEGHWLTKTERVWVAD